MNFIEKMQAVLADRKVYTENGALAYETTGKALLDLNFAAASLRSMQENEIVGKFLLAFYEDEMLAWKWLFFLRDARKGLGERRSFRVIMAYMADNYSEPVHKLAVLFAEYGRFDDLLCLFGTKEEERALGLIQNQLLRDLENQKAGKAVSLCAKWMPSLNASSKDAMANAVKIRNYMGLTSKEYRKMLAGLRASLEVAEVHMSAGRWQCINYEHVASRANLLYRRAFMIHDKDRREAYLEAVGNHTAKINAGVLMPHDIVARYTEADGWRQRVKAEDAALELLWSNLKDTVSGAEDVLCVVDGSGSMTVPVGDGGVTALHVSNALGIYFAERLKGAFKNCYITFSAKPKLVNLTSFKTLRKKLEIAFLQNDCSNTNIEATFDLILDVAVRSRMAQKDLPKTILIISDMEFDAASYGQHTETLFGTIRLKFARFGYVMPKLVFWNVNSRSGAIPVKENRLGVGLVSGFSVNVCDMVLSGELDPYKCLKKTLDGERYKKVEEVLSE